MVIRPSGFSFSSCWKPSPPPPCLQRPKGPARDETPGGLGPDTPRTGDIPPPGPMVLIGHRLPFHEEPCGAWLGPSFDSLRLPSPPFHAVQPWRGCEAPPGPGIHPSLAR